MRAPSWLAAVLSSATQVGALKGAATSQGRVGPVSTAASTVASGWPLELLATASVAASGLAPLELVAPELVPPELVPLEPELVLPIMPLVLLLLELLVSPELEDVDGVSLTHAISAAPKTVEVRTSARERRFIWPLRVPCSHRA
jgi:hypothetical protein